MWGEEPTTVKTEHVANWLETNKSNLVGHLHVEGVDYIVEKVEKTARPGPPVKQGGNNYKKVLLTPRCFKRICMLSRTRQGDAVRDYFLDVESRLSTSSQQQITP